MRPTRTAALAALVLVALVAPASAVALTSTSAHRGTPSAVAPHADATETADDESDDPGGEPTEPADDPTDDSTEAAGPGPASAAGAAGRAHAIAMQAWAHCVGEAASGPKTGQRVGPPKLACGDKPVGPGRAAHALTRATAPPSSAAPGRSRPHGKSGAHRH